MATVPVLTIPDFTKTFVIETDASGGGIGAAMMQEGKPLAYISKTLSQRHQALSTYEKELLAVVYAVEKWRSYLIGRHFVVEIDHFSLKYILE